MSSCKIIVSVVLLAVISVAAVCGEETASAVHLRFSGILGQSQPAESEPLSEIGVEGAFTNQDGTLYLVAGGAVYNAVRHQESGAWQVERKSELPAVARHCEWDGAAAYVLGVDSAIYRFAPGSEAATSKVETICKLETRPSAMAIVPITQQNSGIGNCGKILILHGNNIIGFTEFGQPCGKLFTLPSDIKGAWNSIGIDPESGDLLAGAGYPDRIVRRFSVNGDEVKNKRWPMRVTCEMMQTTPTETWICHGLFGFHSVCGGTNSPNKNEIAFIKNYWTHRATAITRLSDGSVCIASSQGAVFFDRDGKPLSQRIGGITGIRQMAVATDGTLLAVCEDSHRVLRLSISDKPNAQLTCNSYEPWYVGGGWKGGSGGLVWARTEFLVLDRVQNKLWRFHPTKTGWAETPWQSLTKENTFTAPSALAAGDTNIWVLDGSTLSEISCQNYEITNTFPLPQWRDSTATKFIAASNDRQLFVASEKSLMAIDHSPEGDYAERWTYDGGFTAISALACSDAYVVVVDSSENQLFLLNTETGAVEASTDLLQIAESMQAGCVALYRNWIFLHDQTGKRILRYKIESVKSSQ